MELWLSQAEITVSTLLAFFRLTAFFVVAPFPGVKAPAVGRIALAAGCAWAFSGRLPPVSESMLLGALATEVVLGLIAGFLLLLIVQAFAFGGEVVGNQMGLGTPGYGNPLEAHLTLLGSTYAIIAIGVYAAGDGPLLLFAFLSRFLEVVPPGVFSLLVDGQAVSVAAGRTLIASGVEAAAPVIASVFAAQLVLAMLARSVPRLNWLIEGPSLTYGAGFIGLTASVYTFAPLIDAGFARRFDDIVRWIGA